MWVEVSGVAATVDQTLEASPRVALFVDFAYAERNLHSLWGSPVSLPTPVWR